MAQRNLLKYAAGRLIFCPGCGDIMDCRRTVVAEVFVDKQDGQGEKPGGKTWTHCGKCYDKRKPMFESARQKVLGEHPDWFIRFEVIDGREVFSRKKKGSK